MSTPAPDRAALHLRVFVSSPGDVGDERRRAHAVLLRVPEALGAAGRLEIEPVQWDDKVTPVPLEAGRSPQASVDDYKPLPSECDLTIVVLSTRLGSPAVRPDGTRIASGTVAEFESALRAGKPVFVYRSQQALSVLATEPRADQDARVEQFRAVAAFFDAHFRNAAGELTGGYNDYEDAEAFEQLLAKHVQAFAQRKLDEYLKPYWVPGADDAHFFVGRTTDLARVRELVLKGRNVCIHRAPGVGKTALALELARDRGTVLRAFAGVLWLSLGQQPELQMQRQLEEWACALNVPQELRATVEDWMPEIAQRIGTRRMLIVLDDVWQHEQAAEFMRIAPKSVFVLTTRHLDVVASLDNIADEQLIELADLDLDHGLALLTHYAPKAVASLPDRARALVKEVDGRPLALELMGKYLRGESLVEGRDFIAAAFDVLERADEQMKLRRGRKATRKGAPDDTLEEIIDVSWRGLGSDPLREAFAALSVFRPKPYWFTLQMAAAACEIGDALGVLRTLVRAGLVDSRDTEFAMHPIIHSFAQQKLAPERLQTLQRGVLAWFGRDVNRLIERDGADLYAGWYRYERPDWQNAKDNWLYYLAISGDTRGSMLAFLRVYFDAFWWWGFFEPFAFCGRLVEDWRRRGIGSDQRKGLDLLRRFADNYPTGMGRRGSKTGWHAAEAALLEIRSSLHLDDDTDAGEDACQVRDFTDFLLAECEVYGRGNLEAATRRLERAHAALASRGDLWSAGYLSFYLAHFELDAGRPESAHVHVARGFEEAAAQADDPELLANLHRAQADAHSQQGERAKATAAYRRAACYAFAYQAIPESADSYTVRFFNDLADRLCERVLSLAQTDLNSAYELADSLRKLFDSWWALHPAAAGLSYRHAITDNDPGVLRRSVFAPMPNTEPRELLLRLASDVLQVVDEVCREAGVPRPKLAAAAGD